MMDYGPIVRIILRYLVGAGVMGSTEMGEYLAADPDLIFFGSMAIGAIVEAFYAIAKKRGGAT